MSTFKNAKVIILPTNEPSKLGNLATYQGHSLAKVIKEGVKPINTIVQFWNLYIISNDKIKEDDWCIDSNRNIFQHKNHFPISIGQRKIIATTDTSLLIDTYINQGDTVKGDLIIKRGSDYTTGLKGRINLPQPSKQFIQKYVKEYNKGNITTDVLVEYEIQRQCVKCKTIRSHYLCKCGEQDNYENTLQLKINPKDNTITIKKVKDSYTKEEVVQLLIDCCVEISSIDGKLKSREPADLYKWIKENL